MQSAAREGQEPYYRRGALAPHGDRSDWFERAPALLREAVARHDPAAAGAIGRATAPGPEGPWQPDPAPVLTPGAPGAWDDQQVSAPDVVRTEQGYVMYYGGVPRQGLGMIGMATSSDGVRWTKHDDPATADAPFAESDPVLQPGPEGSWEESFVHQPRVAPAGDG